MQSGSRGGLWCDLKGIIRKEMPQAPTNQSERTECSLGGLDWTRTPGPSVGVRGGSLEDGVTFKAMTDFQLELKYFNITPTGKSYMVCTSGISAWNK